MIGDIVLLQDKNSLKGNWKLAQVVKTIIGSDKRIRDVTVKYKIVKLGREYKD